MARVYKVIAQVEADDDGMREGSAQQWKGFYRQIRPRLLAYDRLDGWLTVPIQIRELAQDRCCGNEERLMDGGPAFLSSTLMEEFHIREAASTSAKVKPPPKTSKIPSQFFYGPSDDGTDENLLIFLHGLGVLD